MSAPPAAGAAHTGGGDAAAAAAAVAHFQTLFGVPRLAGVLPAMSQVRVCPGRGCTARKAGRAAERSVCMRGVACVMPARQMCCRMHALGQAPRPGPVMPALFCSECVRMAAATAQGHPTRPRFIHSRASPGGRYCTGGHMRGRGGRAGVPGVRARAQLPARAGGATGPAARRGSRRLPRGRAPPARQRRRRRQPRARRQPYR